jgi:TrmH family RNA methyltransferase
MVLEDLQDPGNLGTIMRTGEGAGIDGVILSKGCVDIYNPKTIRSTMGSLYRVPFLYVEDLAQTIADLKAKGITFYAAHLKGERFYDEFDFTKEGGCAFLIGNEGNGLKDETADLADTYLKIPMEGKLESLNAAVASSILMYEVYRQKRINK